MIVLGFPENVAQASALAAELRCAHATIEVHRFPDGESRLKLPPQLPATVLLFRTLDRPNDKLVELLIAAGGARALGATRLILVAPYLCYMRQDIAFTPGEPVSQKIVGKILANAFDVVVTVDPHLHRVATLAEAVPAKAAIALTAAGLIGDWLALRLPPDALLLGPDEESAQWVGRVALPGGFACAVARKQRFGDREVRVTLPPLELEGRTVVLVDDVIASGQTLVETAKLLYAAGVTRVEAIATHGLFAAGAREALAAAGISPVLTSDAIPGDSAAIPLAGLLAQALRSELAGSVEVHG